MPEFVSIGGNLIPKIKYDAMMAAERLKLAEKVAKESIEEVVKEVKKEVPEIKVKWGSDFRKPKKKK